MHDDGEVVDEDEDGDGNIDEPDRGRPARRKVGETYAVPVDPTGASYDLADSSSARAPALRIPGTTLNLAPTPSAIRRGHALVASRA